MIVIIIILIAVFVLSIISEVHVLGLWFFMMITHGLLVEVLGASAEHLPMYSGLIIMGMITVRGKWTGVPTSTWLLMSSLVFFVAMAAMFGMDPPGSIDRLILYSKGFVLAAFVGGVIANDDQIRTVTLYCLLGVVIGDYIAISEHLTGQYSINKGEDYQRAAGLTGDPNDTAMLLLTGIPLALYWATHSTKRFTKFLFVGVIILTIGAITLTQSRGGGVALIVVLGLIFLRRPTMKAFIAGIVILSMGLLFASGDYLKRMESLATTADSTDMSLDARYQFVVTGIEIFVNNPILGVGMGNYGKALVEFNANYDERELNHVAHNIYLEFYVENGFFAGSLFLMLLASALLYSIRYDNYDRSETSAYGLGFCVSMSLIAVLTAGLFLSQGRSSVLWFLVGLGLAFHKVLKKKAIPSQEYRLGRGSFPG